MTSAQIDRMNELLKKYGGLGQFVLMERLEAAEADTRRINLIEETGSDIVAHDRGSEGFEWSAGRNGVFDKFSWSQKKRGLREAIDELAAAKGAK